MNNYFPGLALLLTAMITGCSSIYIPPSDVTGTVEINLEDLAARTLRPDDRIQVSYIRDVAGRTGDYKLADLDEIEVRIRDRDDLSGSYLVIPDGWLYLPLLDPIAVKGKTIKDVRELLMKKYSKVLKSPQVHVGLKSYDQSVDKFISSLAQNSTLGPVYEAVVNRDGRAEFPLLGALMVQGKTMETIGAELRERYKTRLPHVDITVRRLDNPADLVTVLGEVRQPTAFPVNSSVSLVQALGIAGGWTTEATLTHVIVVQQKGKKLTVRQLDIRKNILASTQIRLVAGDMVYVPRSVPADINTLVDQLIRRNNPVNFNFNHSLNP